MPYDLTKTSALVTGASRFGRGGPHIAYELARRGCPSIYLSHRDEEKAGAVRNWILDSGYKGSVELLHAELSNPADVTKMFRKISPDIVINNAASFGKPEHAAGEAPDTWLEKEHAALRNHLAANLESAFLVTQSAMRRLREDGKSGRFAFIGDATLRTSFNYDPGYLAYSFSKAYVPDVVRKLAETYGREGMKFVGFLFGPVQAPPNAPRATIEQMQNQLKLPADEAREWLGFERVARYVVSQVEHMDSIANGNTLYVDAARSVDNLPEH